MKILTVKEYNTKQEIKYNKAVKEWDYKKGGFPYIGFYLFFDEKGNRGEKGFVAVDAIRAIWRPTKIGVKRVYNRMIKEGF